MSDSEKRRENPLVFFIEFLEAIWMDNTEEEAIYQWEVKVKHFPWYASDALYCIEAVIANPPNDLIDILENHGWIGLYDETPDEIKPYSFDETLNWLKKMHDKFRRVYEKGRGL